MGTVEVGQAMRLALIALALSALAPSAGLAAPPHPPETPERHAAAEEFKRGKQLYATDDFAGALQAFTHGYELFPLRGFLVNIGQCQRRLGKLHEAVASYEKFLEGTGGSPALRSEVEDALAEVREAERKAAPVSPPKPVVEEEHPAPAPVAAPVENPEMLPPGVALSATVAERPKKKRLVWALVGVGAAVVVAGATVGLVLGLRPHDPSGGSLGLIDARQH